MLAYRHGTGSLPQRSIIQFLFELLVAKLRETLFPKRFQTCDVNPVLPFYLCQIALEFTGKDITRLVLDISFSQQILGADFKQMPSITLHQIVFQPKQGGLDELSQLCFILQLVLCTRQFHHKLEIRQRHHDFRFFPFHAVHFHELSQNKHQLFLGNVPRLMQTLHIIEVTLMVVGSGNTLYLRITRGTPYLLNIVDKRTGWRHMIYTVYITDIYSHTKGFRSHNQFLGSFLELLHNGSFLFLVLLAIIGGDQTPVCRLHPRLQAHVDATRKRIIEQCLVTVQEVFDPRSNYALLCLVVCLPVLHLHLTDVKANIPALHRTYIKHTRLHLQRTDSLEYHVSTPFRVPDSRSSQCKQRETITESLFQRIQVTSQEPIVHTELLAPCRYRMCLIDHYQTDAALAYKMLDVVREKQFRREIEQINLPLTHLPVNLHLLFRR